MNLKKFSLTNLIISFVLILGAYLISSYYIKFYSDCPMLKFVKYLNLKNNTVKIVNLGSSHSAYGIYFSLTDNKKMNLGMSSQNLYYDLQLLKKYEEKILKNSVVIIPISIFSFYSHFDENINQRYSSLLKKKNILGIDNKTYFLTKNFLIFYPPANIVKVIKKLRDNNDDLVSGVKYPRNLNLEEKKKKSISTAQSHLGISHGKYSIKNAEEDFINLIDYIESKNWNYVLITTPFSYLYNENIEKYQKGAFKERIYNNIKEVEEKLGKKFVYLDYSHDSRLLKMCLFFINFYNVPEKLFMVFNIPIHYLTQVKFEENMRKYCHWFAKIQSETLPSQNSCTYLQEI